MARVIFGANPQRVEIFQETGAVPAQIALSNNKITKESTFFARKGADVTRDSVSGKPSASTAKTVLISGWESVEGSRHVFSYSLDDVIYLYRFGFSMGKIKVSGLAFPDSCEEPKKSEIRTEAETLTPATKSRIKNGYSVVLRWWKNTNIINNETLTQIYIEGVVLNGFLTNFTAGSAGSPDDKNWHGIIRFSFDYEMLPRGKETA